MSTYDRRVQSVSKAHYAELERRCHLIAKFVPRSWLSLQYRHSMVEQPKIVANPK